MPGFLHTDDFAPVSRIGVQPAFVSTICSSNLFNTPFDGRLQVQ
jgi:hypothetical protein